MNDVRIGILNGGGDCAGLNAVTRAVVRRAEGYGWKIAGIRQGWKGLLDFDIVELSYADVKDILKSGGTILKTSRTNPFNHPDGARVVFENVQRANLDALIAVGGDDTLRAAARLHGLGLKVVGVPKTIDNDLSATDFTFGFDSSVNEAMHSIDNLKTTGQSHGRVMLVEVMGRNAGWVAAYAGLAGGADLILVPEVPFSTDEVAAYVRARHAGEEKSMIVVMGEGAIPKDWPPESLKEVDEFGHPKPGGVAERLATEIEEKTGCETRATRLGHVIRGGTPTAFDRVLATRFGLAAVDLVKENKFGMMVALRGTEILSVSLQEATFRAKLLDPSIYDAARAFFLTAPK